MRHSKGGLFDDDSIAARQPMMFRRAAEMRRWSRCLSGHGDSRCGFNLFVSRLADLRYLFHFCFLAVCCRGAASLISLLLLFPPLRAFAWPSSVCRQALWRATCVCTRPFPHRRVVAIREQPDFAATIMQEMRTRNRTWQAETDRHCVFPASKATRHALFPIIPSYGGTTSILHKPSTIVSTASRKHEPELVAIRIQTLHVS